jgi:hypothetical protein
MLGNDCDDSVEAAHTIAAISEKESSIKKSLQRLPLACSLE